MGRGPAIVAAAVASAGAFALLPGPAGSLGVALAAALVGIAARRAGPAVALLVLLFASVLQNLLVSPLAGDVDRGTVLVALAAKEVLALAVGAAGLVGLYRRIGLPGIAGRLRAADVAALVYLALVLLVAGAAGAGSLAGLATLRQALTLPFLWLVGRTLALDTNEAGRAVAVVLRVGLFAAAFGLAERFLLGDGFWHDLGLADLYEKKGLGAFLEGTLPGNFTSWDWGRPIRRLVGPLGEPTTMAHLLALPAAWAVVAGSVGPWGRGRIAVAAVLVLALGLTLGKSGAATFLAGVAAGLWGRGPAFRRAGIAVLALLCVAFAAAVAASPNLQKNLALHAAGFFHLAELGAGALGGGFGTAGNFTAALAANSSVGVATESFFAALAVQAGLAAVLAFGIFFAAAAWDLLVPVAGGGPRDVRAVLAGVVAATGLTSLASESPVGFLAGGLVFLVAGALAAPPEPRTP